MKQVLLIDVVSSLRNYISNKLAGVGVTVLYAETVEKGLELISKNYISLIVVECNISRNDFFDFLAKVKENPLNEDIPIMTIIYHVNKNDISLFASYNVEKVFSKPVRADEIVVALSEFLEVKFTFDTTPCILDIRVNEDVIFVELAQGLNRDKIEILQFRIDELVELYGFTHPKILVLMSDLNLNYSDVTNLEYLVDNILAIKNVNPKNIRVLTLNTLICEFFNNNAQYKIKVASSLSTALSELFSEKVETQDIIEQVISEKDSIAEDGPKTLEMRLKVDSIGSLSVALVDDDPVILKLMSDIFSSIGANISQFESGEAFVKSFTDDLYDIVFLDIMMPGMNGIDVLMKIQEKKAKTPFVILSSIAQRSFVFSALEKGVKRYLVKPINRDLILRKTKEILGVNI